ncbi:MAG: AMP-binding protein [Myxococcales bacterium]|nr:AMP-binding protein [Myxococcales bacterium]
MQHLIRETRLWPLVEERAGLTPDALLGQDELGRSLTFGAFQVRAERVAAALAERGVGPGDRVAWQLPGWLESFVLVAALARIGAVQSPILPIYREREVGFILRQARPKLFVVPREWRGFAFETYARQLLTEIVSESQPMSLLVCDRSLPEASPHELPPWEPGNERSPRWIFYTSGTTGDPKGALHSDETLGAGSLGVAERFELSPDDRYPVVFPFTHIGGIGMLFVQLMTGCSAALVEQYDEQKTPSFLAEQDITLAAGGTPLVMRYLQYQRQHPEHRLFPRLRMAMGGAAPKPPQLHDEVKEHLGGAGVVSVYGLTEVPFAAVGSPRDPDVALATTEGRGAGGAELRCVSADGRSCATGVEGELQVRGPQVCIGYLDSARDAEAFTDDGWFRTGDLARLDADGFVSVTGRLKEIIIRKGENISAKEVEDVLYAHPGIREIAVIGVPDAETGERCCAVVVAEPNAALDLDELARFCRTAGLATQKWPERLEQLDELPRNASGKVRKIDLERRFGERE